MPDSSTVSWLTTVSIDDGNFKSALDRANSEELDEALQFALDHRQKGRFGKIRSTIVRNLREQKAEGGFANPADVETWEEAVQRVQREFEYNKREADRILDPETPEGNVHLILLGTTPAVIKFAFANSVEGERREVIRAYAKRHSVELPSVSSEPSAEEARIQALLKKHCSPDWRTAAEAASEAQLLSAYHDAKHPLRLSLISVMTKRGISVPVEAEPLSHTASPALARAEADHAALGALATGAAAVGDATPSLPSLPSVKPLPSKTIDLKLVDENLEHDTPSLIDRKQFVALCNEWTPEQCEAAVKFALAACEESRRQSAIWDLRTGVLLHFYKATLALPGKRKIGFWEKAEKAFNVNRATISRKMRLATIWATEQGATEETLQLLASTEDPTNAEIPAVKLALDWIGDDTTSDLYRKHKLVNVGPQGGYRATKADGTARDAKRTKAQIAQEEFELDGHAVLTKLRAALDQLATIHGPHKKGEPVPRPWDLLDDKALEALKLAAYDLQQGCIASQQRRAALRISSQKGTKETKGSQDLQELTEVTEG